VTNTESIRHFPIGHVSLFQFPLVWGRRPHSWPLQGSSIFARANAARQPYLTYPYPSCIFSYFPSARRCYCSPAGAPLLPTRPEREAPTDALWLSRRLTFVRARLRERFFTPRHAHATMSAPFDESSGNSASELDIPIHDDDESGASTLTTHATHPSTTHHTLPFTTLTPFPSVSVGVFLSPLQSTRLSTPTIRQSSMQ
jgi:hypothetical protein